ncbi:hypothetical protein D3C72_2293070 [compost metagenome]
MSSTRTWRAPAWANAFLAAGRFSFFDTSELNQRHWVANSMLWSTMPARNAASPPSHQSSAFWPPKLSSGAPVTAFPRLRSLRSEPLLASVSDA